VMAQASRDAGLEGIFFDNEEYFEKMWTYPADVKYPSKTLVQYQEQYRLRGNQVMSAIIAEWPECKIVTLHGPYVSDSRTPASVTDGQISATNNDLRGYFFAGMLAAAPGQVIDGGEVYQYRTTDDFLNSYTWRNTSMPNLSPNSLIPASLTDIWLSKSSISFGLFDTQWKAGWSMNQATWQSDITNALRQADYMLWTYAESNDYLTPGGVDPSWITAIWNARSAASLPAPGTNNGPAPVPSNVQASSITSNTAIISWNVSPSSTGQVEYGTTIAYRGFTTLETHYLSFHRQNVSGLPAGNPVSLPSPRNGFKR
jgi:hypothetical protein